MSTIHVGARVTAVSRFANTGHIGLVSRSYRQSQFVCRRVFASNLRSADQEPIPSGATLKSLPSALKDVDRLLASTSSADEEQAVKIVSDLTEQGLLKGFGRGQQVPKRDYTLAELRLNQIEPEKYLSPTDNTLNQVRTNLQVAFAVGLTAGYFTQTFDFSQLLTTVFGGLFLLSLDQVVNNGGLEALVVDTAGRLLAPSYPQRVAAHEAAHFLVAYLVALMPKCYTLSALDAFIRSRQLNVQAGTQFCDAAFQREVAKGELSSSSLDQYTCVALAGVAVEYLQYGKAEGGLADVQQLDGMMRALRFTQKKADAQVRWSVLNTTLMLRRHSLAHSRLAAAMARGNTVGECIQIIEENLATEDKL